MKISKKDHDEAIATLHKFLKPNDRIGCILRHVSSSGMSRRISFVVATADGIRNLDHWIEGALGYRQSDKGGLVVSGCGMDMGFSVVYNLGATMWPNGTPEPHGHRNGEPDNAGGYALKHEWI